MTKTYIMNGLVEKMQSSDQDFRYMGLNDLLVAIKEDPTTFLGDEPTETKVLRQVLQLVEDKISEVKNQAVKCLGQLIKIIRESQMEFVVDRLIDFSSGKDDELRDISSLALKTITSELPPEGKIAAKACEKLAPKLLTQLASSDTPPDTLLETLSILSILITRFPAYLASPDLKPQPLSVLTPMLSHPRPAVRKRAITTLAQFLPTTQAEQFTELLNANILPGLTPKASLEDQRTTVQLVAAVARHTPHQIGPVLGEIIPGIIKAVERDDEELQESCLQALEALVLRCPTEVTPFLPQIIQVGNHFIKYDPNYAGDVEDEDEEMANDDDDDDAELDEEYSDDEDTSYKIRRSATKLLAAVIGTRPELLATLYKEVSPILIFRFGDREETVRVEVWTTYASLLKQTGVYGEVVQTKEMVGGKRKRDEEVEVEGTPKNLLKAQVPTLAKALINQLKSQKMSAITQQAGFSLLHTLLTVLPGCLANFAPQIIATSKTVLTQSHKTSASALHITCMSFVALFFSTHSPSVYVDSLDGILPILLKSLGEKHPRIASEAFRVFSALLNAMQPVKGATWVDTVYNEAVQRLSNHDTDAEVRASAEVCIGDLWVCATDVMKTKSRREWEAMCRTTGRTDGAVQVVTRVAREVDIDDDWVNGCLRWLLGLLRKSGRSGKADMFVCLDALLRRYQAGVPADLPPSLLPSLKSYITTSDIQLMSQALSIVALLLELSPKITFPEVEAELLKDMYDIAHSPLVAGAAFDSILAFFAALVEADMQVATHVVPNLVTSIEKESKSDASQSNVARCIGQVVRSQRAVAAGTIVEFSKHLKASAKAKPSQVVLSLLVMGEIGRFVDMSLQENIFSQVIERFSADQEEVRTAAAFAAGNIAVGNLHHFLPVIVKMVQHDSEKRLLSLHALKEVVTHCSHGQLETVADMLWVPLFENSDNAEETTRNVAAACLGKLTITHPSLYLPQLHERISDENLAARATVISAIRYTFAESSSSYDEQLNGVLMDFLALIADPDLTVRRLALSTLNQAARLKPHLIRDQLQIILPNLYKETVVNPDLIRTVQMGPWTHKVDDGLEARKTAYETLYTLLDTCLAKLDLHEFIGRVLAGLADDSDEVKVICHMMLFRLSQVAPTAVAQRLDEITPLLEKSMKGATVTKDTVKQDIERAAELQRSTLRAVAALSRINQPGASLRFDAFVESMKKGEWGTEFRELVGA
ncbi:TIP120-domain-containing protein [Laetiporus sulphureus 93-53]|uniref:TIP120-domain-containing protein n=1 Tax=Laetiporus sulphureus 93-53 TaxID=1314785 RepID=A0A165FHC4_9APHY|nr:TIP120-domain-containing protein [Laetiporus sulphureus 93-53]KZT08972.1 TIP120-domain-containing protein [Laetiporus sulphureus 93-53]